MAGMFKRRSGAREEPDPNFYASHPGKSKRRQQIVIVMICNDFFLKSE